MRYNNNRQVPRVADEEYLAKWEAANKKNAARNNPASRRKATIDCEIGDVAYQVGDMMPMVDYRIMKKFIELYGEPT